MPAFKAAFSSSSKANCVQGKFGVFPLSEVTFRSLSPVALDQFQDSLKPLSVHAQRTFLVLGESWELYLLKDFTRKGNRNMFTKAHKYKGVSCYSVHHALSKGCGPALGRAPFPTPCFHSGGMALPGEPGSMGNHGSGMWVDTAFARRWYV